MQIALISAVTLAVAMNIAASLRTAYIESRDSVGGGPPIYFDVLRTVIIEVVGFQLLVALEKHEGRLPSAAQMAIRIGTLAVPVLHFWLIGKCLQAGERAGDRLRWREADQVASRSVGDETQ